MKNKVNYYKRVLGFNSKRDYAVNGVLCDYYKVTTTQVCYWSRSNSTWIKSLKYSSVSNFNEVLISKKFKIQKLTKKELFLELL